MLMYICIQGRDVRSNHKGSLETHGNAICSLVVLELSTCDQIAQDGCKYQV